MAKSGHFEDLASLLTLEAHEEEQKLAAESRGQGSAAEKKGTALTSLAIRDQHPALGGRAIATLGKRNQSLPLPWNRLSVGSPVLLTEEGVSDQRGWRGGVFRGGPQTIEIALAGVPGSGGE